jgi:tetratricopeptide (TPR) repeat protein
MADRKVILMRITIIFFIIIWSLLLPIYFGNANVRATVIAPNSEENVDYLISIAVEAYEQGMYEQAIEYFDRALGIDPNNIDALVGKGIALDYLGRYQEAIVYYDSALGIDPNNIDALINKGIALDGLGRYQEAIVYYDSALGIDPNNASALYNRGNSLAGLENCVEAIQNYDEVLSIDPNYRPALINKGACLGNLGRHQEAARYFEPSPLVQESSISEASTTEKNHFVLITNVGEKGYSLKNLLQSYTDLDFENLRLNNLNGYKETYELQYISHGNPIDVTAITAEVNKGVFRFQTGEYQGAIVIFDEILRVNILHPDELVQNQVVASLYNKALCLEQQGNLTGAEYYRNEARNLDSQYQGGYIIEGPKLSAPVLALVFSEPRK